LSYYKHSYEDLLGTGMSGKAESMTAALRCCACCYFAISSV
jgi:hypothetical protein